LETQSLRKVPVKRKLTPQQTDIFFNYTQYKYLIIRKGRRFGLTQGAAEAYVTYLGKGITPLLWVDTINGNIDRYFERYFLPILRQIPKELWNFNQQKRILRINDAICDFRSADQPESIEGFGYKKIFLNEAGIILKDDYLYSHAILPMLLDYPDSQLIAGGVPKGIHKKNGDKHKFFELYERALNGEPGFRTLHYTSYDNPLIQKEEIDKLIKQMTPQEAQQEIFGEFLEYSGNNPYAHNFISEKHEADVKVDAHKQIFMSIDFNLNPFAAIFAHKWRDNAGEHLHIFDEVEIQNGSIEKMIDTIVERYKHFISTMQITGDYTGRKRQQGLPDLASYWNQIERGLNKYGFRGSQLKLLPNPFHSNARSDVNYFLYHFPDIKINPVKCLNLCRDLRIVQVDNFGEIIKHSRTDAAQRADYMDCFIYLVHNFFGDSLDKHQKTNRW